ncbi:hypothetical protein HY522_09430 [bacterium]|nr:hypothetical protein [bacterium]
MSIPGPTAPIPASAEELEMMVITVYGKETYKIHREIFELLAPARKEELSMLKLGKKPPLAVSEPETRAVPVAAVEEFIDTESYALFPSGEVADLRAARTGLLLYFVMPGREIENVHLEFSAADGGLQDFYLKRVFKDQYVEVNLTPGLYRLAFSAEGMEPGRADTLVVRADQVSLGIVPLEKKSEPPPPPAVAVDTTPPPPPPAVEVRLFPLKKAFQAPGVRPTMVARGRLKMKEEGMPNVQMRLYEREVGFFDPYNPGVEAALLAVTVTDDEGDFEFPPIDNDDGYLEGTRDPVIVLELENRHLSVLKPFTLTRPVPYRFVIYERENVQPKAGLLEIGTIDVRIRKEFPVLLFQSALPKVIRMNVPIQILYPEGSTLRLSKRQLRVPSNTPVEEVLNYLDYLTQ